MQEPIRSLPFGTTRSRVTRNYALITPDTHVTSPLLGWKNASAVVHISPEMGARFLQYTATLAADAASAPPGLGVERFFYVLEGAVRLTMNENEHELSAGHFAFVPPNVEHCISTAAKASAPARLAVFEKRYQTLPGAAAPQAVVGDEKHFAGAEFMGDSALQLQTFLPIEPSFDLAVNRFTYQPGGTLPQVEIHVMEHGLLMLEGAGVYRLGDDYFPVQAGDVIWMASYCPQWFVAMGKQPARYLYYKDIHRESLLS